MISTDISYNILFFFRTCLFIDVEKRWLRGSPRRDMPRPKGCCGGVYGLRGPGMPGPWRPKSWAMVHCSGFAVSVSIAYIYIYMYI